MKAVTLKLLEDAGNFIIDCRRSGEPNPMTMEQSLNHEYYEWAEGVWKDPKQRTAENAHLMNDVRGELTLMGFKITR